MEKKAAPFAPLGRPDWEIPMPQAALKIASPLWAEIGESFCSGGRSESPLHVNVFLAESKTRIRNLHARSRQVKWYIFAAAFYINVQT